MMKVIRIAIKSVMGISEMEIAPGAFTVLSSANGMGKSSFIQAVLSAFGGGHDATLLRNGASEAETVIDLSDDLLEGPIRIAQKITAEKSTVSVTHPEMGKISRPVEYLKRLIPALSLSPIEFLLANEKRQAAMVLEALPLKVTPEQIAAITKDEAHVKSYRFPCEHKHALEVLAEVEHQQFDQRTGVNRALKEKRASLNELRTTIPEDATEPGDWAARSEELEQQLVELTHAHTAALGAVTERHAAAKHAADKARAEWRAKVIEAAGDMVAKVNTDEQAEIATIRAKYATLREKVHTERDHDLQIGQEAYDADVVTADAAAVTERDAVNTAYEPQQAALSEALGESRARVEQEVGFSKTREILAKMEREADVLDREATRLTDAVEGVRALRTQLTAELPIAGLEIRDGALYVDGVPFARVNEARRMTIAVELALLKSGKLGFLVVDGAERLDSATLALLAAETAKRGVQCIVTRVTDDKELTISDLDAAEGKWPNEANAQP